MSTPRPRTWIALGAALAVAAAALLVLRATRREPPLRLVVASVRQPATSLFYVAQASGCLAAERLEVEEKSFALGRDALTLLLAGGADVGVAYETPVLRRYLDDDRLRVLSTLHTSTRNTRLLARRDRGIATVRDLGGKRVGAARGTNTEFFVDSLLAFGGVPRADVTIVDLAPEDTPAALASGAVDAAAIFDPVAARARAAVGGDAVEILTDLYTEFSLIATRADVLAGHRDALVAFLRAISCAEDFAQAHPAEAFAAVRARFPEQGERELADALGRVTRGVGLDEVLMAVLRREAEWLAARERRAVPDLSRLVDPGPLDEVEPEAMNLLPLSRR